MHHLQQERLQDDGVESFEEGLDQPGLREVFRGPRLLFLLFSFFLSTKPTTAVSTELRRVRLYPVLLSP